MPTIYRVEDSEGSAQKGMDATLAGTVTFDGKRTGKVMPAEYQALLIGDEIKPLPHPLEWSSLRAYKQTYLSASLRGILLRVERRICLQCGHVFDAPRIVFAGIAGCFPGLLAAVAAFTLLRFVVGMSTHEALLTAWVILMVVAVIVDFAGTLYVRLRFSERQSSIAQPRCRACGSSSSVSISSMAGKRVPIGSEGKWIQVSIAGKS